jgi:hypothetical protein
VIGAAFPFAPVTNQPTPDMLALGVKEGWKLVTVVDVGTKHPYWMIFGTTLADRAARQHVLSKAKQGSRLHIAVLHLLTHSRQPPTPTRKKR